MSEYRVNLDVFSGPLDLLLYLIRKEEVDIYDIPLARITEQYLKYMEIINNLDIDLASEFMIMAATLMHIKSAMLLPKSETGEAESNDMNDPRSELIRQLLEYKKFKDAANLLDDAAQDQLNRFSRPSYLIDQLKQNSEPELDLEQITVWDMLEAFDALMTATGRNVDIRQITDDTPIDFYQIEILHRLQTDGPTSFERVFEGRSNKLSMIGIFLAILELIRDKLIWAEQEQTSSKIYLKALTDEPAEAAVKKTMMSSSNALEDKLPDSNQQPAEAQTDAVIEAIEPSDEPEAEEQELDDIDQQLAAIAEHELKIPIEEITAKAENNTDIQVFDSENLRIPIAQLPPKPQTKQPKMPAEKKVDSSEQTSEN